MSESQKSNTQSDAMRLRVQLNDNERFKFDVLPNDTLKVRAFGCFVSQLTPRFRTSSCG